MSKMPLPFFAGRWYNDEKPRRGGMERGMTLKKKILLGGIAVVVVAIAVVAYLYGSRLKAAVSMAQSANMTAEDVEAKSEENTQITQEMQSDYKIPEIEVTPEIKVAVAQREMTLEEAATQLLADEKAKRAEETVTPEQSESVAQPSEPVTPPETVTPPEPVTTPEPVTPSEPVTPPEPVTTPEPVTPSEPVTPPEPVTPSEPVTPPEPAPEEPKEDDGASESAQLNAVDPEEEAKTERIQNLFVRLYVLRDAFDVRLENLVQDAIDEFLALEPDKQTNAAKVRIVYARISDVEKMEAECDADVKEIVDQLNELDPAIGEKAWQYYLNEKELKRANLIARYTGKPTE